MLQILNNANVSKHLSDCEMICKLSELSYNLSFKQVLKQLTASYGQSTN